MIAYFRLCGMEYAGLEINEWLYLWGDLAEHNKRAMLLSGLKVPRGPAKDSLTGISRLNRPNLAHPDLQPAPGRARYGINPAPLNAAKETKT